MGTTLTNGVYLPNEGERNCYAGLKTNWEILDQKVADVTALQQAVAGALHREIVESLPTTDINPNTIYMILSGTSATENVYNEFMYVNNAWELIGTSATDLTNYYTKAEVDGKLLLKANDSDVVHKSGNETIGGNKEFTGTTKAHDVVPSATNSYNLGGSQYQWNNAYIKSLTINGVACGDILTHNVSEFVDVTGEQTIGGRKIFSNGQTGVGRDLYHFATFPYGKNTPPANTSYQYIWFSGNTTSQGFTDVWYGGYIEQVVNTNGSARGRWLIRDTSESALGIELFVDGNDKQFRPNPNNAVDLGTSTNKWKSFNGVEPSALSLPDLNNGIDISSYIDTTQTSQYTAPANGYISICGYSSSSTNAILIKDHDYDFVMTARALTTNLGATTYLIVPVIKNHVYDIICNLITTISYAKFFPCQGNV